MTVPSITVLAANVASSVRTAEEVLSYLEASLRNGGFEKGLPEYLKLGETLANQRLWSRREAPSEDLDRLFGALAARARALYGMLAPYSELMRQLAALDALGTEPYSMEKPADDPILEALASGEMSLTALRTRTGAARAEIESYLNRLEQEGRVVFRIASGRRFYRLV